MKNLISIVAVTINVLSSTLALPTASINETQWSNQYNLALEGHFVNHDKREAALGHAGTIQAFYNVQCSDWGIKSPAGAIKSYGHHSECIENNSRHALYLGFGCKKTRLRLYWNNEHCKGKDFYTVDSAPGCHPIDLDARNWRSTGYECLELGP